MRSFDDYYYDHGLPMYNEVDDADLQNDYTVSDGVEQSQEVSEYLEMVALQVMHDLVPLLPANVHHEALVEPVVVEEEHFVGETAENELFDDQEFMN